MPIGMMARDRQVAAKDNVETPLRTMPSIAKQIGASCPTIRLVAIGILKVDRRLRTVVEINSAGNKEVVHVPLFCRRVSIEQQVKA